ncbi:MAG: AAA family ATPase, partial [Sulfurihydrogenibium sp.]|nr:AAA family ATPase [Sulfurihydrogenibium sp.]
MKELPIGIQTFEKIINENCYYVDKTPFIKKLEQGGYYFLSRPRRFGKSLFLDTIKEAFSGNKELFKGLYIYDKWDWNKKHPIIKISFAIGTNNNSEKLKSTISFNLKNVAYDYKINLEEEELNLKFYELIRKLYEKYNEKVVILVDEYDKPILDAIENIEYAKENREILKDFYSVLKDADPYIKLAFLTGVSRFSKVSIFSGLNQLNDITLDPNFATICGYTQTDLETVFADRIKDFDKEEVRKWYNGYSWLGEKVYNPFDILLLFDKKIFRPYWFETGTPTFLIKLFKQNKYYLPELENLEVGEELLSNLDIDDLYVENLLFQTGYLTIKDVIEEPTERIFILSYPNFEVKKSFNSYFLLYFLQDKSIKSKTDIAIKLALRDNQIEKLKDILHRFF